MDGCGRCTGPPRARFCLGMTAEPAWGGPFHHTGTKKGLGWIIRGPCTSRDAEGVGFEPTVTTGATPVFETGPFNHSGTPPAGVRESTTPAGRPPIQGLGNRGGV